ncbi:BPTI/Kunitz domain-containing protein 4-like isoform X3 [Pomacea canaliculata]|uniref:BPTI/Kunitz domain-containing protein 4-like isoform X2 n=1 Tax=Pomacea canaliculata TaxID=400727 RepID=UPI000D729331|nr:BPTI/Kunitz domain-containing protein 4-like isoform X2 [Pomacea canaliculata]XP_025090711.1 BPTI/Kunitz domain-containing protein 4-like isoform X3 [Pomacea canaliculata]
MASGMVSALLVFVVLMVGKAGAGAPAPPPNRCGPVCARACRYGNVLDKNGCPTCRCIKEPVCPPVKCRACPSGYIFEDGCQTCTCKPRPECPMIKCALNCPYGYVYKEGCRTCTCQSGYKCQDTCKVFCADRVAIKSAFCAQCPCV